MKIIIFVGVLCTSMFSYAQYPGQVQYMGPREGTVLRTWLANTTIRWEPATRYFTVKTGQPINWNGTVEAEQVQTNYFAEEVVTQQAKQVYEVTGHYVVNEQDPFCISSQNNAPVEQRRRCPYTPVTKEIYGWVAYRQQTGQRDGGSQRTVIHRQPVRVSASLSGQILRDYETERFTFTVDENAQISASVAGSYNKYTIDAQSTSNVSATVVVQGLGRNLSKEDGAIPADVFFAEGNAPIVGQASDQPGHIFVKFRIDNRIFTTTADPKAQLKVTYELLQTNGGHSWDNSFKSLGARTVTFENPQALNDYQIDLWGAGRGRHTRARLYFNITGSQWYSDRTFRNETDTLLTK